MINTNVSIIALAVVGGSIVLADEKAKTPSDTTKPTVVATEALKDSRSPTVEAVPAFESLDTNGDGYVSKDEFIAYHTSRLANHFSVLDKDNSATLTKVELDFTVRRPPVASVMRSPAATVRRPPAAAVNRRPVGSPVQPGVPSGTFIRPPAVAELPQNKAGGKGQNASAVEPPTVTK